MVYKPFLLFCTMKKEWAAKRQPDIETSSDQSQTVGFQYNCKVFYESFRGLTEINDSEWICDHQ